MAKYFYYNTEQRRKVRVEIAKTFSQVIEQIFHGKTVENIRKRVNLAFIDKSDAHRKLYQESKIFFDYIIAQNDHFDLCSFDKGSIDFTKPIYFGFCVLEVSKILKYECYCNKKQPIFGIDSLELLEI